MAARRNPGMAALALIAAGTRRAAAVDAYQLGFVLGPRVCRRSWWGLPISAPGCASTVIRALAATWAQLLDGHNKERREIEAQTLAAAIELVERKTKAADRRCWCSPPGGWHPGVIGIVAARLRGKAPGVVALSDGISRGSGARSVPELALGSTRWSAAPEPTS